MIEETTVNLERTNTDGMARRNEAYIKVVSEKPILASIMKSVIDEYKGCSIDEIVNMIEGTPQVSAVPVHQAGHGSSVTGMDTVDSSVSERAERYDILFRATAPSSDKPITRIINLEIRDKYDPDNPMANEGLYYCSELISAQITDVSDDSAFWDLKKVYSVWICMNPPESHANTVAYYEIVEKCIVGEYKRPVEEYDLFAVVEIFLGGPGKGNYEGVTRMLDILLSDKISKAEKLKVLREDYGIEMSDTADLETLSSGD